MLLMVSLVIFKRPADGRKWNLLSLSDFGVQQSRLLPGGSMYQCKPDSYWTSNNTSRKMSLFIFDQHCVFIFSQWHCYNLCRFALQWWYVPTNSLVGQLSQPTFELISEQIFPQSFETTNTCTLLTNTHPPPTCAVLDWNQMQTDATDLSSNYQVWVFILPQLMLV